ncbi:MAG: hypothetical protein ABL921_18115 [Pirellula sp.]
MLKNTISNGYSSQVRGWLVIGGVQHELAQVGPDFCILREPISSDSLYSADTQAELIVEVDGDQREMAIIFCSNHPSSPKKLLFRTVGAA